MGSISHAARLVKSPHLRLVVSNLKRKTKTEEAGPCPFCGGCDRFIAFDNGRGWCRQCNWKGDSIQLLRDRDGLSFRDAVAQLGCEEMPSPAVRSDTAKARALATVTQQYLDWQKKKLRDLCEQYTDLQAEKEFAEVATRQLLRCPDLYTEAERQCWTTMLTSTYDLLAVCETDLDVMTFDEYEAARFGWWREEVSRGD
jgi:hypothetical protein